jgi:hypothetical protein
MKTIHKYHLALAEVQVIEVPQGAQFLTVQMQGERLCVWAIVDTTHQNAHESFVIVGTGALLPDTSNWQYMETVQQYDGRFVWHVFRAIK